MRDDAVLFVVAITDEDEQPVPDQSAKEVVDKLVAAKGTIDNVVFLGSGGGSQCDRPYGGAEEAVKLREVAELFAAQNRGLFWDLPGRPQAGVPGRPRRGRRGVHRVRAARVIAVTARSLPVISRINGLA